MLLTDEKLYELCRLYGERARIWRQKFLGLLPEVYKRRLYAQKGFSSIFEFAAKLAGASEEQVCRVLNLERRFQDKPDLHKALVEGEVSVNKLIRVAPIANCENQKFLAEQAKLLPKSALAVFVRDEKAQSLRSYGVPGHVSGEQSEIWQEAALPEPQLSGEVKQKLYDLQEKGIDVNAFILEALERRERKIEEEKQRLAGEQAKMRGARQRAATSGAQNASGTEGVGPAAPLSAAVDSRAISRHIPVKIERLVRQEYGSKCAVPGCGRDSAHIHHEIPFAMMRSHNPYFLKPLCEEHHVIAHNINLAYLRRRTSTKMPK